MPEVVERMFLMCCSLLKIQLQSVVAHGRGQPHLISGSQEMASRSSAGLPLLHCSWRSIAGGGKMLVTIVPAEAAASRCSLVQTEVRPVKLPSTVQENETCNFTRTSGATLGYYSPYLMTSKSSSLIFKLATSLPRYIQKLLYLM